jgi:hypothetical protein
MPSARTDARWSDAVRVTVALWLFILIIFLPALFARHHGENWGGVALDASTVIVSIGFALGLFTVFRASADLPPSRRVVLIAVATFLTAVLQTIFDLLFTAWVAEHLRESWSAVPVDLARASGSLLNYVCVFTVNVALFQLSFSRRRSLTRERQLAAAQSAAQQAQLEALRLQLNPHFLFNTLNAISSMILTRRNEDAELMTDKLSSFLRASLACDPSELVPVEEELGLIGDYLDIEAVRFGERLLVDIRCDAAARDVRVPGMLIQPLVENAIKYGVAASRDPVTIAISASIEDDMLCLTVCNDGGTEIVPAKTGSVGVGLNNVRRRLAALYADKASLCAAPIQGGFEAKICVPIRAGAAASPVRILPAG